jgi:hypothetical protein
MIKASLHTLTTVAESIPKKQVQFHDHSTHCHHYEQMGLIEKEHLDLEGSNKTMRISMS